MLIKYSGTQKQFVWKHRNPLLKGHHHVRHPLPAMGARHNHKLEEDTALRFVLCLCPLQMTWLFVQAHGWTLVHAHVCIAKKSACTALNPSGVQRVQVLQRHLQVLSNFWTGCHLWNVEAILTTISICHAVKEEPGRVILPVLHKSNIVARFYAENSK